MTYSAGASKNKKCQCRVLNNIEPFSDSTAVCVGERLSMLQVTVTVKPYVFSSRGLNAYRICFENPRNTIVLEPQPYFFKYFLKEE